MKAYEFIHESDFGVEPKRPRRPGSRPERGHTPVSRFNPVTGDKKVDELSPPVIGAIGGSQPNTGTIATTSQSATPQTQQPAQQLVKPGQIMPVQVGDKQHQLPVTKVMGQDLEFDASAITNQPKGASKLTVKGALKPK